MADRRLACLAALALFTGCGGGVSRAPAPPASASASAGASVPSVPSGPSVPSVRGRVLTAADDGFTGSLRVGETALLRRARVGRRLPEPSVRGDAVIVFRGADATGAGYEEWEVRAVRPGTAQVRLPRADGDPAVLTFVVG
ncbi:hypothetical protein [Streptomyces sp. NRRL S-87]|uniref:hypothetical protein n=1 Tax=Streptomyces sp. NRRL S-87 TaxID=1463920 RepID=UPI0004BF8DFC|nr:hypothetical protein [Streptomyces sp. NRRL S-87]